MGRGKSLGWGEVVGDVGLEGGGGEGLGGSLGVCKGLGNGHTTQEVTPAMRDYKQCALSTSAVLERTTTETLKGGCL